MNIGYYLENMENGLYCLLTFSSSINKEFIHAPKSNIQREERRAVMHDCDLSKDIIVTATKRHWPHVFLGMMSFELECCIR